MPIALPFPSLRRRLWLRRPLTAKVQVLTPALSVHSLSEQSALGPYSPGSALRGRSLLVLALGRLSLAEVLAREQEWMLEQRRALVRLLGRGRVLGLRCCRGGRRRRGP